MSTHYVFPYMTTKTLTTRERLLDTALEAFAKDGYSGASVRTICNDACVNGASIHYHFGGKDALYVAVFEHFGKKLEENFAVLDPALPLQSLQKFYVERLANLASDSQAPLLLTIFRREEVSPTGLLEQYLEQHFKRHEDAFTEFVKGVVGGTALPPEEIHAVAVTLASLPTAYFLGRRWIEAQHPESYTEAGRKALALRIASHGVAVLSSLKGGRG